jgi:hypothetical protein
MANYYTMRNDQSIWGSFLRAVAIELARIEYMYSYDVVAKNPQYLTPPDIKREYANPLFVTGNFQQLSQFDSGDFGASFGQWAADTGMILRTAILDSNGNVQIATTAGQTGSVEPSWALTTGATTIDGSVIWTNAGAAPATLAYPIGYRDMLVDLLAAYQEGATPKSIQDVIYAYTGKNIVVEELYKLISEGFYDQSDRNAVKVSVNVGGDDPLVDIESLQELQQITNSLYGAIDLSKPAHVGLEFTTVFGSDENIDCFISPQYLTQAQLNTLPSSQQVYYVLIAYVAAPISWAANTSYALGTIIQDSNGYLQRVITAGVSGAVEPDWTTILDAVTPDNLAEWENIGSPEIAWITSTNYVVGTTIQDTNGNIQLAVTGGVSGVTQPVWNASLQGVTTDGQVTWVNIGTPQITIAAYAALTASQKPHYQGYYQDLNCVGTGINDTLRIIIQQYEEPPFDPMLYQAPIFDVNNPTTTLAAYGRMLLSPLSSANWLALQNTPQVWNDLGTYSKGTLVRAVSASTPGSFSLGVWTPGGWQLYRALKKNGIGSAGGVQNPLTSPTYWIPLAGVGGQFAPSVYQAYYLATNGQYIASNLQQWTPGLSFYTGQYAIDNNGNLELAVIGGTTAPVVSVLTSPSAVTISNNVLTVNVASTLAQMGLVAGVSSVTLLNFAFSTFLNNLTLPVVAVGTALSPPVNSISMPFVHADYSSGTNSEGSAIVRIAFSTTNDVPTYDGTVLWQFLGSNYINNPAKWIQVVGNANTPTGEVANWDVNHQMGLLAPRTDLENGPRLGDWWQRHVQQL